MMNSFSPFQNNNHKHVHIQQIKEWVDQVLMTEEKEEYTTMVTELQCKEEGCPPIETVIALLKGKSKEMKKIHKALEEVTYNDVEKAFKGKDTHDH